MAINPLTGLEEDEVLGGMSPAPLNPQVKDYLMQKYNLGQYNDAARAEIANQGPSWGDRASAALSAIGAGFQGGNSVQAAQSSLAQAANQRQQALSDFDKGRANKIQEIGLERDLVKQDREDEAYSREQEKLNREMDPTSQESMLAQSLAKKMMPNTDFSAMSASKINSMLPSLAKVYDIEQKKLDRQEAREERRFQSGIKLDEKAQALKTPFGLANSVDDAKKLKDAAEAKSNFDAKISEMIALREKHGGGAIFNREDVSRGKQLSKDLLLAYKDMAKLGVLSQADEKILNAIIPEDPLQYNSPVAAIQGQDPTLHRLKKFKEDSEKDFQTRIGMRTREGIEKQTNPEVPKQASQPKEVERKTKDGRIAIFDAETKQFLRYK